jgi:hypothetical protein
MSRRTSQAEMFRDDSRTGRFLYAANDGKPSIGNGISCSGRVIHHFKQMAGTYAIPY